MVKGLGIPCALATTECINVRIVSVHQYPRLDRLQRNGQEVSGPEDAILSCPSPLRVSVQTVNEYDINFGVWVRVYFCRLEACDFVRIDSGALCIHTSSLDFSMHTSGERSVESNREIRKTRAYHPSVVL